MSKCYLYKNIRLLLREGFAEGELRDFCFDEPDFKPVHPQLAPGVGHDEIIRQLLAYAERKMLLDTLLAWAKETNPSKYVAHQPYYESPKDVSTAYPPKPQALPNPLMNCETELAAFARMATGQDTQTRLISVHGNSGTGKSRLLDEYERVAGENKLNVLRIPLAQQLSIEDCLYQIVCHFGLRHCTQYETFLAIGRPEPLTRAREAEWQEQLTRRFWVDISQSTALSRLALFFDQYEKADYVFKEWFTRIFLPGLFTQQPLIVVVAGQEKVETKAIGPGQRHFHLNGLSVEWFHRYVADCQVPLDPHLIDEFHKLLNGYPKRFVDYVRGMAQGGQ